MDFKPRTHFEQVPLEVVKKLAKIDERKYAANPTEQNGKPVERTREALDTPSTDPLQVMNSSFDIFQVELDGSFLWQGLAADIEEAKRRVKELQLSMPSQYMVVSLRTGSKLFIDCDAPSGQQSATAPAGIPQRA
jgi:hypothetical protein